MLICIVEFPLQSKALKAVRISYASWQDVSKKAIFKYRQFSAKSEYFLSPGPKEVASSTH